MTWLCSQSQAPMAAGPVCCSLSRPFEQQHLAKVRWRVPPAPHTVTCVMLLPWCAHIPPLTGPWSLLPPLPRELLDGFAPSLVFYGPSEMLPSGAPGDPALEYSKARRGSCGAFTSGELYVTTQLAHTAPAEAPAVCAAASTGRSWAWLIMQ